MESSVKTSSDSQGFPLQTIVLDPELLANIRSEIKAGTSNDLNQALATLIVQADAWVHQWKDEGPWTVTRKISCTHLETSMTT